MSETWYGEQAICSWSQLMHYFEKHTRSSDDGDGEQWVFRGQKDSTWPLKTTLERAFANVFPSSGEEQEVVLPDVGKLEVGLLRKFQRECHRFRLSSAPAKDDILEWLAWMQHYGAPTRLLDCTYSFLIAAFFAVENAGDVPNRPSAVWALNVGAMRAELERIIRSQGDAGQWRQYCRDDDLTDKRTFAGLFMARPPLRIAASVNPFKLNERLVVQQGVFLCPGNVLLPFVDNLKSMVVYRDAQQLPVVIKYCITSEPSVRRDILRHLLRLNISRASLFPDLGGFAGSLWQWLVFPKIVASEAPSTA